MALKSLVFYLILNFIFDSFQNFSLIKPYNQVPYNKTHIISVHFTWNNIRFYMMDCNWEKFYENKAENDFYDEEWKENFFGSNTFFTKLGPYGNCHIFSSMVSQSKLSKKNCCF